VIDGKTYQDGIGSRTALRSILRVGEPFNYVHDFGDWWAHHVEVSRTYEVPNRRHYPNVIAGAGKALKEDSGGPPAYADVTRSPDETAELHEIHLKMATWRIEVLMYPG
jgi:Plasmid pRiA4b ORF-3-like protein